MKPPCCGPELLGGVASAADKLLGVAQVIAATNRADILDPALMRSGRLDRKVEFPHPNEDARTKILQIHSRKMNVGCAPGPASACIVPCYHCRQPLASMLPWPPGSRSMMVVQLPYLS